MTKHIRSLLLLGLLAPGLCGHAQNPPAAIIPKPVSTQWQDGHFGLDATTVIVADPAQKATVAFFDDYLQRYYGLTLHIVATAPAGNYIQFQTAGGSSPRDGRYTLKATPASIVITGDTDPGTF